MGKQKGPMRSHERERFWRKVIAGQRRSGMSVVAWCGQQRVSAPSFYAWRRELAKRRAEEKSRRSPILPVKIISSAAEESRVPLEIELPSQVRVRVRLGCELELLRQVLMILRADR